MPSLTDFARRIGAVVRAPQQAEPVLVRFEQGFHGEEGGWRWMSRTGVFVTAAGARRVRLSLTCGQAGYYERLPFAVRIYVNDSLGETCVFSDGEQTREVTLRLSTKAESRVRIEAESAFIPSKFWISSDARELSVRVAGVTEASPAPSANEPRMVDWQCNICGRNVQSPTAALHRETPSCPQCGSSVRLRAIVHILSTELFGQSMSLLDLPEDRTLRGVGLSDWAGYADVLARKFDYTNTFYHQSPRLDIMATDPAMAGTLDFLICTEVFEHVPPPVSRAFQNARLLLKPTGVMIFSTPYGLQDETWEHFPELHQYELIKRDGGTVLVNTTADGRRQEFRNLIFHGGPGATLEMRMASLNGLRREFASAGFAEPRIYGEDVLEYGIRWGEPWSLPMAARPA
jgi:SAM-dependent methyltransferase